MSARFASKLLVTAECEGWSASHDGLGVSAYQAIQDESGTVVALVVAQSDDYAADPDPEPYSRLFSAAPDLLVALELMLNQFTKTPSSLRDSDARCKAHAAILKATGSYAIRATGSASHG